MSDQNAVAKSIQDLIAASARQAAEKAAAKAAEGLPDLESVHQFLFEAPLYAKFNISRELAKALYGRLEEVKFDAFCPFCKKQTTFSLTKAFMNDADWQRLSSQNTYSSVSVTCARAKHHVHFWFHLFEMTVRKVGQNPSLADISNGEIAQYRSSMDKQDGKEFYMANGLAANGVGVGSFVYLRRVFERLIYKRFNEFKIEEKWSDAKFKKLRMEEKVKFLKKHLPDFLVKNWKIYSILSQGVHELDEAECLTHFEVLKASIIMILEEDKQTKERLAKRDNLSQAIAKMNETIAGKGGGNPG